MRTIRRIAALCGLVAAGMCAGAVLVSFVWWKHVAFTACVTVMETALDAYQIRQGKADAVAHRKMEALPMMVEAADKVYRRYVSKDTFNSTMWSVSRAYEGVQRVPAGVEAVLKTVPPRPPTFCETQQGEEKE